MKDNSVKVISFYLPQFHAIPENDEWWGTGFTEWINVREATPLFNGHYQPRVPLKNNYYNLLDDEVKQWQIDLAKSYGIYGFCFYHYWFNGKLMLEKPIEQFLFNKKLDLPFCLCWANPPWTKVWAKQGSVILIDQIYGDEEQWEKHFQYLLPYFMDKRYIKKDGEPLFIIYEPSQIPRLKDLTNYLRKRIKEEGFPGFKLAYQYFQEPSKDDMVRPYFDYDIEFQPVTALNTMQSVVQQKRTRFLKTVNNLFYRIAGKAPRDYLLKKIRISDYDAVWGEILNTIPKDEKSVPCAFTDWDNTPRHGLRGRVFVGGSPDKFGKYMEQLIYKTKHEYRKDFLFITAWNEWAEGAYLEPDMRNGFRFLEALNKSISKNKDN
jgi:lipopolysaccharide biosynthesis protein